MPSGLDGNPNPIVSRQRSAVLSKLVSEIERRRRPERSLRVAIDGIDGGGKSTLADELGQRLAQRSVPVIRSTTDSFHNPRATRWAKGKLSPVGFYEDWHDLAALRDALLDPLSASPLGLCRTAIFDELSDSAIDEPAVTPEPDVVLLFDGLFLQRDELRGYWDFSIYVDAEARVAAQRIRRACENCPQGPLALVHLTWWWTVLGRYMNGFALYVKQCSPSSRADVVIDNNDLAEPSLRWSR